MNTNGSTDGPRRAAHRLTTVLVAGARDRLSATPPSAGPLSGASLPGQAACRRALECTVVNLSVRTAKLVMLEDSAFVANRSSSRLSVHPWTTSVSRNSQPWQCIGFITTQRP